METWICRLYVFNFWYCRCGWIRSQHFPRGCWQTAPFRGHFHLNICTQMVANGGMGGPYIDGHSGTCHHSPHIGFYLAGTPLWKEAEHRANSSLKAFSGDAVNRKNLHDLLGPNNWCNPSWAGLRMSCSCRLYTWLVARKCQSETKTRSGIWDFAARLLEMWYTAIDSIWITWSSGSYKGRTSLRGPIGLGRWQIDDIQRRYENGDLCIFMSRSVTFASKSMYSTKCAKVTC